MMPIISCPDMEREPGWEIKRASSYHLPTHNDCVVIAAIVISASTVLVIRFVRRKPDALAQENEGAGSVATQDTSGQTLEEVEEVAAKTGTIDQIAAKADADNPGVGSLGIEG
jgi:hypothetical protein